jgi:tetratricopeptide (TPR) repeat protein
MTPAKAVLCVLCLLTAAAALAADKDEPLDRRLDKAAEYARNDRSNETYKAVKTCEEAIAAKDTTEEQRIRAFSILVQAYQSQKSIPAATKAAVRLRETMPESKVAEEASLLLQAELLRTQKNPDGAMEKVQELIDRQPDNPEAYRRQAELLLEASKNREAYDAAAKAVDLKPQKDETLERSLRVMLEAAGRLPDHEKCVAVLNRLLEVNAAGRRDDWAARDLRRRLVTSLIALKKYDEARAVAGEAEKNDRDDSQRQSWTAIIGDCYLEEKKYDEALVAFERVFTEYRTSESWFATQRKIVDTLAKKGSAAEALKAAHVLLDASYEPHSIAESARIAAEAFKAVDGNVARANALIAFQRFGPKGEDGNGSLKDPLQEVGYPSCAEREKAFTEFRKQAGDNAAASRFRAMTFLYSGHPKDALKYFLDAFGRCTTDEAQPRADELILIGARAARGHPVGMEEFYKYLNYGPAGEDGQAGNADDLSDPFAPLLK